MKSLLLAIVGFTLLSSFVGLRAGAQPQPLQIAFQTNLPNDDICIINMDGSDLRCLMETADRWDRNAIWSPDGRYLSYQSIDRAGEAASRTYIYDFANDLTPELTRAFYIYDWSPDGQFLLTVRRESMEDDGEIYLLRPDESETVLLTDNEVDDYSPSWSPDGNQIAYLSGFPDASLMVMTADGTEMRVLVDEPLINREVRLAWSPDSQTIAFVVNGEMVAPDQTSEIYLVNADGTGLRQLTDSGNVVLNPRWSPEGGQIVFYGYEPGAFASDAPPNNRTDIFIMNADGSDLMNLTSSYGLDYHPSWSPDGEWIAFASTRASPGIFIMRPDGSDVRMVTNELPFAEGGRDITDPVWRPVAGGGG
jgi:TolB protein